MSACLLGEPASAIVADPPPRVCAAYASADVVLSGMVTAGRTTSDWHVWQVKADRWYKGRMPGRFSLYSANTSARATPDVGKRNMLFVHRENGRLIARGSDPNTSGKAGQRIEQEVRALAARGRAGPGSVVGLVAQEDGAPYAGWRVRLHPDGSRRFHYARTDARGRFSIRLPPGTWHAQVAEKGWASRISVYSYDDPDRFTVTAGGCTDIRLEPVPR